MYVLECHDCCEIVLHLLKLFRTTVNFGPGAHAGAPWNMHCSSYPKQAIFWVWNSFGQEVHMAHHLGKQDVIKPKSSKIQKCMFLTKE